MSFTACRVHQRSMMFMSRIKGRAFFHVRGGTSNKDIIYEIAQCLPEVGVRYIETTERTVSFKNKYPIVGPRLLYGGVDRGRFSVENKGDKTIVSYMVSVDTLLGLASAMTAVLLLVVAIAGGSQHPTVFLYPLGLGLWLFGVNHILISIRTHMFLQRCLRKFSV